MGSRSDILPGLASEVSRQQIRKYPRGRACPPRGAVSKPRLYLLDLEGDGNEAEGTNEYGNYAERKLTCPKKRSESLGPVASDSPTQHGSQNLVIA